MPGRFITLGWHLDGQRPFAPRDALGKAHLGPAGLLTLLETQLGLLAARPAHAERIVQYRECLKQLDSPERFYHASFQADELGTAAQLLAWRDEWHLHGWNGTLPSDAPPRLQDMADLETWALRMVAPGIGQRLEAVAAALQQATPDIDQVRLVEPLATWPSRWQTVLAALPTLAPQPLQPRGTGFLGTLQQALQAASTGNAGPPLPWHEDGSVVVVRAETPLLAQHWLAHSQAQAPATLLVCEAEGTRLDAQRAAAGAPRYGLTEAATTRDALQVLPLALDLLWEPLHDQALLAFLLHPLCPLPPDVARPMALQVAEAPGVGGPHWQKVLEQADGHEDAEPDAREQVAWWVENERFSPAAGASLSCVIERVTRLSDFLATCLQPAGTPRAEAAAAARAQCSTCIKLLRGLQRQGDTHIRPAQLHKLLAQAVAGGSENPLGFPEVGAGQVVQHPGAVLEPAERIVWLPLARPNLPQGHPWSAREVAALARAGCNLPRVADQLEWASHAWLRPVLAAQKQLVLVLPAPGEDLHPLWHMLEAVVEQPLMTQLEHSLRVPGPALAPLEAAPLPPPKRWWHLPPGVMIKARKAESFSSLEKFLNTPDQWVLKYAARLAPSRLIRGGRDALLYGNLAHGLVEEHFLAADALAMPAEDFATWFEQAFERHIQQRGAHLLRPGRGVAREAFRRQLFDAMAHMREQFALAGVVRVAPEKKVTGLFPGGTLEGTIDLVLKTATGGYVVVDLKWSSAANYIKKLKTNRHLQLAIYAELVRQKIDAWPAVAYFSLKEGQFIAPNRDTFAAAQTAAARSPESTPHVWARLVETWHWRNAQLQAGRVEVVCEAAPADEASTPPATALAPDDPKDAFNDYRALIGWSHP